jgi:hypothetical protein
MTEAFMRGGSGRLAPRADGGSWKAAREAFLDEARRLLQRERPVDLALFQELVRHGGPALRRASERIAVLPLLRVVADHAEVEEEVFNKEIDRAMQVGMAMRSSSKVRCRPGRAGLPRARGREPSQPLPPSCVHLAWARHAPWPRCPVPQRRKKVSEEKLSGGSPPQSPQSSSDHSFSDAQKASPGPQASLLGGISPGKRGSAAALLLTRPKESSTPSSDNVDGTPDKLRGSPSKSLAFDAADAATPSGAAPE